MAYDHSVGSPMTEADAVRARYARREPTAKIPRCRCSSQERERAVLGWLRKPASPVRRRVCSRSGCGTGGNLLDLIRFGFAAVESYRR